MKSFFQQIVLGAKAKYRKPGVFNKVNNSRNYNFDPAPYYWALIPVKPQSLQKNKPKTDFDDCI